MKLKRIILITLFYICSVGCSYIPAAQIEGDDCDPSYSCPSYCGVEHIHCKDLNKIEQEDNNNNEGG